MKPRPTTTDAASYAPVEGVWTLEIKGPYAWSNGGVMVLEHGSAVCGGEGFVALGSYRLSGARIEAELAVTYYSRPDTVFDEDLRDFTVHFAGESGESGEFGEFGEEVVIGTVSRPDRAQYCLGIRLTKRCALRAVPRQGSGFSLSDRFDERAQA